MKKKFNDEFSLYDLRVEVVKGEKPFVCNHKVGDYFELSGENLSIPAGKTFSVYALATIIPILPVKQRETDKNDWITTDTDITCPDPYCGGRFRIKRIRKRKFRHSEVTVTALNNEEN